VETRGQAGDALNRLGRRGAALAVGLTIALGLSATAASAADKVIFGTNWKAQAEHGGFYQAVAAGIYKDHGLEVEIRPGGPQVNHQQLLAAGKIDFNMSGNNFHAYNYANNKIPMTSVAAMFQKEPQVLLSHPGQGNDKLGDLMGKPILISSGARNSYWLWLKAEYGFTDAQIRPYTFNPAPFLADKKMSQQGYITSEPFAIEKQGGFKPVEHLIADYGYNAYSTLIDTSIKRVKENPDQVKRFVEASILGWVSYLYGDPSAANALIKKDNADMTDEQIAFSIAKLKQHGIVDSGDSLTKGIGAMTDARWQSFFKFASGAGIYPSSLDISTSYTLQFVNNGVGVDLKKKLMAK